MTGMPASLAACSATAIAAALAGATPMPLTSPRATRSWTICTCSSPPPCSPGPMYSQSNLPPDLLGGLHAAVAGLIEERVVHVLRHQREGVLRERRRADAAARPARATVVASSFFMCFLPGCCRGSRGGRSTSLSGLEHSADQRAQAEAAGLHADQDRENDEGADEGALPVGVDPRHQQRVADHLEQRRADDRAVGACRRRPSGWRRRSRSRRSRGARRTGPCALIAEPK